MIIPVRQTEMASEFSSVGEICAWAEALKDEIARKSSVRKSNRRAAAVSTKQRDDLLTAVELLLEQVNAQSDERSESGDVADPRQPPSNSGPDTELGDQLAEIVDASLSQWQAQIANSFEQSATKALSRQLKQSEQLCQDLQGQLTRIAGQERELDEQRKDLREQQQDIEQHLATALRQQSKMARQRKSVAKDLWARKLEIEQEADRLQVDVRQRVEAELHRDFDQQLSDLQQQNAELREQLTEAQEASREFESGWQDLLGEADQRIQELETQLADQPDVDQSTANAEIEDLENQLADALSRLEQTEQVQISLATTQAELEQLRAGHEALQENCEQLQTQLDAEQSNELDPSTELHTQIERLESELQAVQEELLVAEQAQADSSNDADVEELQRELEDLRSQNADLAAQVARHQVEGQSSKPHLPFDQETLSWEERKQLIMRQLESEDAEPEQLSEDTRLEIEQVVAATQLEIERRDKELEELRAIVEQQSDTKQGVAIGAAAIAQMMDQDELVLQERQKLKDMQAQWEEKLRQAEIDLSMERAKLARERNELEAEAVKLQLTDEEQPAGKGRTRKWLEHLGLRDDPN